MYKHRDPKFKCQYCDQRFAFKSELEFHVTVHEGEPSFYCKHKDCNKGFVRLSDLKGHEETHTGEMHYCPYCSLSANDKC